MKTRPISVVLIFLVVGLAVGLAAWRAAGWAQERRPRALFHRSITQGADVPMRAELTLTWRLHGVTHTAQAHVAQGAQGRCRTEYVLPPEARGRVVYSDGRTQWQQEPGRSQAAATNLIPSDAQNERDTEDLIARNYKIVLVSEEEITAGRKTYLLELLPRQPEKSSQKRWIDRQTFKTLRIETHYPDGILARMVAYAPIALPAQVTPADFAPPHALSLRRDASPATSSLLAMHNAAASVRGLGLKDQGAPGFQLTQIASSAVEKAQTAHLLYSDGIETISIFVQNGSLPVLANAPAWHVLRINNQAAFESRDGHLDAVVWARNGHRYTAVSHLGPKALQSFIADQMQSDR